VSRAEAGKRKPSVRVIAAYAKATHVPADDFIMSSQSTPCRPAPTTTEDPPSANDIAVPRRIRINWQTRFLDPEQLRSAIGRQLDEQAPKDVDPKSNYIAVSDRSHDEQPPDLTFNPAALMIAAEVLCRDPAAVAALLKIALASSPAAESG
jgi:hypothetical protein